jgi:hypothetical protein
MNSDFITGLAGDRPSTSIDGLESVMHWFAFGLALMLALAIIGIRTKYVATRLAARLQPAASRERRQHRLVASPQAGIILLAEAIIPVADTMLILAAKGSTRSGFGMHGLRAVLMVLAAMPLMTGVT